MIRPYLLSCSLFILFMIDELGCGWLEVGLRLVSEKSAIACMGALHNLIRVTHSPGSLLAQARFSISGPYCRCSDFSYFFRSLPSSKFPKQVNGNHIAVVSQFRRLLKRLRLQCEFIIRERPLDESITPGTRHYEPLNSNNVPSNRSYQQLTVVPHVSKTRSPSFALLINHRRMSTRPWQTTLLGTLGFCLHCRAFLAGIFIWRLFSGQASNRRHFALSDSP